MSVVSRTASCAQLSGVRLRQYLLTSFSFWFTMQCFHCHLNYGVKLWEQAAICYDILKIQQMKAL